MAKKKKSGVVKKIQAAADRDAQLAREAYARADAWAKSPAGTKYGEVKRG